MSEDQFTKLFKYMQSEFESTRSDIQKVRQDVQRVYEVVDGDTHQREIDDHERAALGLQLHPTGKKLPRGTSNKKALWH